jgi:hypothetical protein
MPEDGFRSRLGVNWKLVRLGGEDIPAAPARRGT